MHLSPVTVASRSPLDACRRHGIAECEEARDHLSPHPRHEPRLPRPVGTGQSGHCGRLGFAGVRNLIVMGIA